MDWTIDISELIRWQKALKGVRERFGMSQESLSKESGVTRSVIANIESGRSSVSVEDTIRMYRVLELRERAKGGGDEVATMLLGFLKLVRGSYERNLVFIDGKLQSLQKEREAYEGWLADVKSEEKQIKVARTGRSGKSKDQSFREKKGVAKCD